jgi:Domain of unknown function (DUF4384)
MNRQLFNRAYQFRCAMALCGVVFLSACASGPSQPQIDQTRENLNPKDRAQRSITNFTPALRCMDDMMFRLGIRDVTLMMEELRDATQKVPVSVRDMMTSSISEMTRRSRAVRLSVFGTDQSNLAQLLQSAQKSSVFAVIPEYNLRGTISQLDEDVRKQGSSFGVLAERIFGLRFGNETKLSVISFDAAMVRTDNFTLVPGVASKNTTVIARRESSAGDGQAKILNGNITFSFNAASAEGNAQAVRNMVELALIELVGKLIRVPYWQCLGTADSDGEVRREMEDWFLSMQREELIVFLKERLRERRYYDGALDGKEDDTFKRSVRSYRSAIGLNADGAVDQNFFDAFVTWPSPVGSLPLLPKKAQTQAPVNPSTSTSTEKVVVALTKSEPIQISIASSGDLVNINVKASLAGYIYCYAQDRETKAIRRIFPNRFTRDPRLLAGQSLTLPGKSKFTLSSKNQFSCIHAPSEVYGDLPPPLRWGDFDDINLPSFGDIQRAFSTASGVDVFLALPFQHRSQH